MEKLQRSQRSHFTVNGFFQILAFRGFFKLITIKLLAFSKLFQLR